MATLSNPFLFVFYFISSFWIVNGGNSWCVARSDASNQALQTALDYACGMGADCLPLQSSGLCFLPNTIQAHASYAYNSYFQRKAMAPGSCDFSGTATIAKTDPSYGSCVYPSSLSTAGGAPTTVTTVPVTSSTNPNNPTTPMTATPFGGNGNTNGLNPGMTPSIPTTTTSDDDNSKASLTYLITTTTRLLLSISFMVVLSFMLTS